LDAGIFPQKTPDSLSDDKTPDLKNSCDKVPTSKNPEQTPVPNGKQFQKYFQEKAERVTFFQALEQE